VEQTRCSLPRGTLSSFREDGVHRVGRRHEFERNIIRERVTAGLEVSSTLIPELLFSILSSCLEHFIVCADHGGFDDAG
jgi:hypothetical protein